MKLHFPCGQPPEGQDVLWRCEAKRYSYVVDADREEYGVTDPRLELRWFRVAKRTPKGAHVAYATTEAGGTYVGLSRNKAFARNTIDEAVRDFKERRKRQIAILKGQLSRARYELALTEEKFNAL
ncbi:hypothetical protein [EBPR siphovirus 2]|nr:hypothetical protein [EBPR siphovirus 2]